MKRSNSFPFSIEVNRATLGLVFQLTIELSWGDSIRLLFGDLSIVVFFVRITS